MTKIVADNTNPFVTNCKHYGVQYLKEKIYKHKVINNIPLTKTQLSKLNKRQLFNFIETHNIDIYKYQDKHIIQYRWFIFDIIYYRNNIHKPYKYRGLVNYFRFLNL